MERGGHVGSSRDRLREHLFETASERRPGSGTRWARSEPLPASRLCALSGTSGERPGFPPPPGMPGVPVNPRPFPAPTAPPASSPIIRARDDSRQAALLLLPLVLGGPPTSQGKPRSAETPDAFRIVVREAGVYRVSFGQLETAGYRGAGLPSRRLGLTNDSRPVPLHVRDGGDGTFGPGDSVEFVGAPPGADGSKLADYAPRTSTSFERWIHRSG